MSERCGRRIWGEEWAGIVGEVNASISRQFAAADESGDVYKLGRALTLHGLIEMRSPSGETLEQIDQQAYDVVFPRKQAIEQKRDTYFQNAATAATVGRFQENAVRPFFGRVEGHADFLMSDAYQDELRGVSDQQRADVYQQELIWLGSVAPNLAAEVAASWMADHVIQKPLAAILAEGVSAAALSASLTKAVVVFAKGSATIEQLSALVRALGQNPDAGAQLAAGLRANNFPRLATGVQGADRIAQAIDGLDDAIPGARVLKYLRNNMGGFGRGATTFFSIWSLFLIDYHATLGDSLKTDVWNTAMATRAIGALPVMADLFVKDLKPFHPVFRRAVQISLRGPAPARTAARTATGFASVLKAISGLGAFGRTFFTMFGGISNVLMLGFSLYGARGEIYNEDSAGFAAKMLSAVSFAAGTVASVGGAANGIAAGLCALGLTVTGVGPAVIAAAAAISAISMVLSIAVDVMWGESDLTGAVRRDLRLLGISTTEEAIENTLTVDEDGGHYIGGPGRVHGSELAERLAEATPAEQQAYVNQIVDGYTSSGDEANLTAVLMRIPHPDFLRLVESSGPRRIASELEDPQQATRVMVKTAYAYDKRHLAPGRAFTEQLLSHAQEHRAATILAFLGVVVEGGLSSDEQMSREAYGRIAPGVIIQATQRLMNGHTNRQEEAALTGLLLKCTSPQFDAVASHGGERFFRHVRGEVSEEAWRSIHDKLSAGGPAAQAHARSLAPPQTPSPRPAPTPPPQGTPTPPPRGTPTPSHQ